MNEDFFRNIFNCCLYIALSVFVLIAAYAAVDLIVDGKEDKEKIFNLATGTWEYRIKAPPLPNMVKDSNEFRAWFKILTKAQQDAVKSKYF